MDLDAVTAVAQPTFPVVVEMMAAAVVDDQEDLAAVVAAYELPQELEERGPLNTSAKRNVNLAVSSATAPKMCAVLRSP